MSTFIDQRLRHLRFHHHHPYSVVEWRFERDLIKSGVTYEIHNRPTDHQFPLRRTRASPSYDRDTSSFTLKRGRRPAGYAIASMARSPSHPHTSLCIMHPSGPRHHRLLGLQICLQHLQPVHSVDLSILVPDLLDI